MGNSILFPHGDDMSAYRITAPPTISEEEEDSLFKRDQEKEEESKKNLTPSDEKIEGLVSKKHLLEKFGIVSDQIPSDIDIDVKEMLAYALIKKDVLQPAIKTLGLKKPLQDRSNKFFRLILSAPSVRKKMGLSHIKLKAEKIGKDEDNIDSKELFNKNKKYFGFKK
jgi:hypothetical protein